MCRSVPHSALEVTRTTTSSSRSTLASGTSSTATSRVALNTTALMQSLPVPTRCLGAGRGARAHPGSAWPASHAAPRPAGPTPRAAASAVTGPSRPALPIAAWLQLTERDTSRAWERPRYAPQCKGTVAMSSIQEILAGYDGLQAAQEAFYRDLHQHPELSHQEQRTAQRVAGQL